MTIGAKYSHLNGLEFLLVHKPCLWQEIQDVIAAVDASACRTKVSREQRTLGEVLYSPVEMNARLKSELATRKWQERRISYWVTDDERLIRRTMTMPAADQKRAIEVSGHQAIRSYNQTDYLKERVAIEVQFGKYAFVAYDLFVKHLAFYMGDVIDVGVEILPTKALQSRMSSGIAYYEGEIYNVIRQGRGVPAVPLVVIGVEP